MANEGEQRRLAAIFSADMVGYSRLMEADERGTIARQKAHRSELINLKIADHHGRIVKLMGDGMLVEFASVVDAVECALAIQRAMAAREAEVPDDRRIQYRVGINLGDIVIEDEDIFGDGVNLAARLQEIAEPGGICISGTVYDQLKSKVEAQYEFLGEQQVKNITEPVRVYRVVLETDVSRAIAGPSRKNGRWLAVAAALVVLLGAGGAALWFKPWASHPLPTARSDKPSIAVLPFDSLSKDPEQAFFADGMAEDIITDLSKIDGLLVIARNSSFSYKGKQVEIRTIARELGVRYVLEGSVRRAGDQVRINAQLIDAKSGGHIWADRFDGELSNVFALQDRISERIVEAMKVSLTKKERVRLKRTPTKNAQAYELFLKARDAHRTFVSKQLKQALSLYEQAIDLDPTFAEAYAGDAAVAALIWRRSNPRIMRRADALKWAKQSAARALALDPDSATTYGVLAMINLDQGQHAEAIRLSEKAVALDPNDAGELLGLAFTLVAAGEPLAAASALEKALRLEPKAPPHRKITIGGIWLQLRQYEKAIETYTTARDEQPSLNVVSVSLLLAVSYAYLDQQDKAKAEVAIALSRWSWGNYSYYRTSLSYLRRKEDIEHHVEGLRRAGVPEWPYGFKGREEDRVTGAEIKTLFFGHRIKGRNRAGVEFEMETDLSGNWIYREARFTLSGQSSIEGDLRCNWSEDLIKGRKFCFPFYRNPAGTAENHNEYISSDIFNVYEQSVVK